MASPLRSTRSAFSWCILAGLVACSSTGESDEFVVTTDAGARRDVGAPANEDATAPEGDAFVVGPDAGPQTAADAALPPADAARDSSILPDTAAPPVDAGTPATDAGTPATDAGTPVTDAGTPATDAGTPATDAGTPVTDAGTPVTDAGTTAVGATCGAATDCRMAAGLVGTCSGLSPAPVCMATGCTITSTTAVDYCDSNRGVCLSGTPANYCVQACAFANSTASPTGCTGANRCNAYGFSRTAAGIVSGVGFCLGVCTSNSTCAAGTVCQVEEGICVAPASYQVYTRAVGSTCTVGTTATCRCLGRTGQAGVCGKACITGPTAGCATGLACAPDVPKTFSDGSPGFTSAPLGLAGTCYKTCVSNANCVTGTYCDTTDVAGSVCKPMP